MQRAIPNLELASRSLICDRVEETLISEYDAADTAVYNLLHITTGVSELHEQKRWAQNCPNCALIASDRRENVGSS
jgi:hypothetical protein